MSYSRGKSPLRRCGTGLQQKRIPSHLSSHLVTAEANPLSALLAQGYSRGESPLSFPRIGLQQKRIPSQLSWQWDTAQVNPLSAFLNTTLLQRRIASQFSWHWAIAKANPLSAFLALGYSRGKYFLSFPRTELLQSRIPSQLSSHWATAEENPLSAFPALGYNRGESLLRFPGTGLQQKGVPYQLSRHLGYSRGESPVSFPGTGLQHRHKLSFPLLKDPALSKILSFNSGVGQNQALRVSHAARNSTILISLSGRIRLFPNPPSIFLFFALLGTADRDIEVPFAVNSGLSEIPSCIEHDRLSLECFACCKVFYRRNFFFPVHLKGRLYYK